MANKSIKGTRTEQNLANSYIAESTAVTRYTFFSDKAKKDSYFQYANIFAETAANELRHAKIFLQYLTEGKVVSAPIGVDPGEIGETVDNLKVAASEEKHEGVELYAAYAKVAREEGFDDIAVRFEKIGSVESHHEARFNKMIERIETDTVWKREKPIKWQCLVCGYVMEGTEPPKKCPVCNHPYQHFQPMEDNY